MPQHIDNPELPAVTGDAVVVVWVLDWLMLAREGVLVETFPKFRHITHDVADAGAPHGALDPGIFVWSNTRHRRSGLEAHLVVVFMRRDRRSILGELFSSARLRAFTEVINGMGVFGQGEGCLEWNK